MREEPERRLLLLARIRAKLLDLQKQNRVGKDTFLNMVQAIDQELLVCEDPDKRESLTDLVTQAGDLDLSLPQNDVWAALFADRTQSLEQKRSEALNAGKTYFDISAYYPGITHVPLTHFSWETVLFDFQALYDRISRGEAAVEDLKTSCGRLFGDLLSWNLPAGFPDLRPNLINRLISADQTSQDLASSFDKSLDLFTVRRKLLLSGVSREKIATGWCESAVRAGRTCNAIKIYLAPRVPVDAARLGRLLVQWHGPGKAALLDQWLRRPDGMHRSEKQVLVYACTGMYPDSAPAKWRAYLKEREVEESTQFFKFNQWYKKNNLFYDLAMVFSMASQMDHDVTELWRGILYNFVHSEASALPHSVTTPPLPADLYALNKAPSSEPPPIPQVIESPEPSDLSPEEDLENLDAPAARLSHADRVVERESTWNRLFKPFLRENMLGIIGLVLLLTAWMTFSKLIWDKGHSFRLLAGLVPLLLLSLGSARLVQLITRSGKEVSYQAVALLGSLCILTLPFYYLIGASILHTSGTYALLLGMGPAVLHMLLTPALAKWLEPAHGYRPARALVSLNAVIYLPVLVNYFKTELLIGAVHTMLFLGFAFLLLEIKRSEGLERQYSRFNWLIFPINYTLSAGITLIYFDVVPSPAACALLAQLVALSIAYFGGRKPVAVTVAGGVSLLGVALAVISPWSLPPALLGGAALWYYLGRRLEAKWPKEILAVHLALLPFAMIAALGMGLSSLAPALFVGTVAVMALERFLKTELKTIAYLSPLFVVGTAVASVLGLPPGMAPIFLPAVIVLGAYQYRRTVKWFTFRSWLLNLLLVWAAVPILITALVSNGGSILLYYLSLSPLLLSFLMERSHDAFARRHGTAVLWMLIFPAFLVHSAAFLSHLTGAAFWPAPMGPAYSPSGLIVVVGLLFAAKKAQSSLPVYMSALLIVLCPIPSLWGQVDWLAYLTPICAALGWALFGLSVTLERKAVWRHLGVPDEWFGARFPFCSSDFLTRPLKYLVWIIAALSVVEAGRQFAPLTTAPVQGLGLVSVLALFGCAAVYHRNPVFSRLTAVPTVIFLASVCSSFPLTFLPLVLIVSLLLFGHLITYLDKGESTVQEYLAAPLNQLFKFLNWRLLALPSFAPYILLYDAPLLALIGYNLVMGFYLERYCARDKPRFFPALLVLHGLVLLCLIAERYQGPFTALPAVGVPLLWIFAVLFAAAWSLEIIKSSYAARYVQSLRIWFGIIAGSFLALVLVLTPTDWYLYLAAYFMLHLADRHQVSELFVSLKVIAALAFGFALPLPDAWFAVVGLITFTSMEQLLIFSSRLPARISFEDKKDVMKRLQVRAGYFLAFFTIISHLTAFLAGWESPPHFALYLLIPYFLWLYRELGLPHLAYLGIALFAYANIFTTSYLLPFFEQWRLTGLHLMSASAMFSMLCYLALGRLIGNKEVGHE